MFRYASVYVVDAETVHSADDLPTGWKDKGAMGLSIGAAWSYQEQRIVWFDRLTVRDMLVRWVDEHALLISYNGIGFDFPLFRALLRQESATHTALCDAFKVLCAASYDVLAEIWRADPQGKYVRGVNSLGAVARANGLGDKTGTGELAPKLWALQRSADVLNYCQHDVFLTKQLAEIASASCGGIQRSTGFLCIRYLCQTATGVGLRDGVPCL